MGIKEQLQELEELEELEEKISKGLEKAYKKMIAFKKEKNSPVIIYEDGKILKVDPKDID